jgi:serine/threonine protein kinase
MIARTISHFELLDELGQTDTGTVYKAYDVLTERHVALKAVHRAVGPTTLHLFVKDWMVTPSVVDFVR